MTTKRMGLALAAAVLTVASGPCGRVIDRPRPLVERRDPTVIPSRLRVLGTVAATGSRNDLNISATVRQQLTDSGITAVRTPGRWESQIDAVQKACVAAVPKVDALLFVWYNRLELFDCTTQRAAYEVTGGSLGINQLADRLVAYLKREDVPAAAP